MAHEDLPAASETLTTHMQEIGSHILPFAVEEGRLIEHAQQPLTQEEIAAIPPDQLAIAAISRMGEYAFLSRPLLNDRVFRSARLSIGYMNSFWEAIATDTRVELKRYGKQPINTSVRICASPEGYTILEDLTLLKTDAVRSAVDRYATAKVPVSKIEDYANEEAERRGLVWDARAKETFMNLYYAGLGYKPTPWSPPLAPNSSAAPRPPKSKSKPPVQKPQPVSVPEKLPTKGAVKQQVKSSRAKYEREQDHLREHASVPDLRGTEWRIVYGNKNGRVEKPEVEAFSTVGEALDHFVSLFGKEVSIHTAASFVRGLCPELGQRVHHQAFNALMVLVEKDERFTKLGVNTLNQSIYCLEAPGAQDKFHVHELQSLVPHIIEAAQAMEITKPTPHMDFLQSVLAKLQVPLPRSDSRMVRLALMVQADKRVVTTSSDQSGINMHVSSLRRRQRTRDGKEETGKLAEDDESAATFRPLIEELAYSLDPNMLTVTRDHLLSRIRKLQPDMSPADEARVISLIARHNSFTPRDEQNDSFEFSAPKTFPRALKKGGALATPAFDSLGVIQLRSQ